MRLIGIVALVGSVAGTILWDGRFNTFSTSADLLTWSWSNQVGPYQYYIHGSSNITSYINFSPAYKNPADSGSTQGAKFTLDSTAYWNGQNMRRIELIPQTTAAINSGKVWYHFSIMRSATNPPSIYREHQICFFESHFTELKSGWISGESGTSDQLLRWDVSGTTYWSTNWTAGVWHNVAYEIDFTSGAGSVAFWHSTGSDPLALTVAAVSVSATSNGADWHLGVLELPVTGVADTNEDYYFSGVYVEDTSLTTSVAGPGGVVIVSSSTSAISSTTKTTSSSSSSVKSSTSSTKPTSSTSSIRSSTSTVKSSTTTSSTKTTLSTSSTKTSSSVASTSSSASQTASGTSSATTPTSTFAPAARWGQCGGYPGVFFGPYVCQSPWVCTYSSPYYSQCL